MVGRNLLPALAANSGLEVFSPARRELDLLDRTAVSSFVRRVRPDLIIHLAGKVGGIQANINQPVEFLVENLGIGMNVVAAALENNVGKLINLGSSCMYPKDRDLLKEDDILSGDLEPTNEGYALAKINVMRLCEYACREFGVQYKTIIPCNLYGPEDDFDLLSGHLIAAAIHKLHVAKKQGAPEVVIWGDGSARREFMYVGDLVDFILLAMRRLEDLPSRINAGTGSDLTVNEYYASVSEVVGFRGKFTHDVTKSAGMQRKLLDVSLARKLGWEARTLLREGIKETYEDFLQSSAAEESM
jgi:GDP-L-fucose synthase